MRIKNKVIIITGASKGIGLATAKLLSKLGAKVVLAARSDDKINSLEKELPNSLSVHTDMTKPEDIKNMVKMTIEKFGKVDILINNAGQGLLSNVEDINIDEYKKIMELNVYSVISAMQEVIPYMRKQGKGMIVNVSSQVTHMNIPGISAYSSTKYALNSISFAARQELHKDNIIVSVIFPKMTSTDFMENSLGKIPNWMKRSEMPNTDSPDKVAKKIVELINSEEEQLDV